MFLFAACLAVLACSCSENEEGTVKDVRASLKIGRGGGRDKSADNRRPGHGQPAYCRRRERCGERHQAGRKQEYQESEGHHQDQLCRVSDGEKRTGGKLTGNGILKH